MSGSAGARREYLATLAVLAAGGALGVVAAGQEWGSATVSSALADTTVSASGRDLVPLASAVSLIALAAVVAVPAVRRLGRRIVGVVLAALGAGATAVTGVVAADLAGHVREWTTTSAGGAGASGPVDAVTTSPGWAWVQVLAAILVLVAGLMVAVRGPVWPGMGAKYERSTPGESGAADTPRDAWDALDRGDDPTA